MKKILGILAILGVSQVYGASVISNSCPELSSIYVNNSNHFAAVDPFGSGKEWVDINQTYGHKLPAINFWRAMGLQVPGANAGVVSDFSCSYEAQPHGTYNSPFSLVAPDYYQKYQVDLSSANWVKQSDEHQPFQPVTYYICIYKKSVADCPFTPVQ